VSHRNGTILFSTEPDQADLFAHQLTYAADVAPVRIGQDPTITRRLEEGGCGDVTLVREGVTCRQRTYVVAESDESTPASPWLRGRVFSGRSAGGRAKCRLQLAFMADVGGRTRGGGP
jgi:hypothetical protein